MDEYYFIESYIQSLILSNIEEYPYYFIVFYGNPNLYYDADIILSSDRLIIDANNNLISDSDVTGVHWEYSRFIDGSGDGLQFYTGFDISEGIPIDLDHYACYTNIDHDLGGYKLPDFLKNNTITVETVGSSSDSSSSFPVEEFQGFGIAILAVILGIVFFKLIRR